MPQEFCAGFGWKAQVKTTYRKIYLPPKAIFFWNHLRAAIADMFTCAIFISVMLFWSEALTFTIFWMKHSVISVTFRKPKSWKSLLQVLSMMRKFIMKSANWPTRRQSRWSKLWLWTFGCETFACEWRGMSLKQQSLNIDTF